MKINIENRVRTVMDLFFTNTSSSNDSNLTCIGSGNRKINKIKIPIYQREYDWEKDELLKLFNNTEEYLSQNLDSNYFVGTVLLESVEAEPDSFELIDGQQRLTSIYLLQYLSYLIAIYRYNNFPTQNFTQTQVIIQINERLTKILQLEKNLFYENLNSPLPNEFNEIFDPIFQDYDGADRNDKIDNRLNLQETLKFLKPKLIHENDDQKLLFNKFLEETKIIKEDDSLSIKLIPNNEFNERAHDAFEFFYKLVSIDSSTSNKIDDILNSMMQKINLFCNKISFCVIVSESPDDSFKLFEVLNSTGRTLTIIDKLKNYLFNKIVEKDKTLNNLGFNQKWNELTDLQDIMGKANLTTDLARSEHGLTTDKYYEYFSNQSIYNSSNKPRLEIFKNENGLEFLERILYQAEMLSKIYTKDCYDLNTKPHSLEWYAKIINKFGYDWGRQVLLGSLIISTHLGNGKLFEANNTWTLTPFDEEDELNKLDKVSKFYSVLFDIVTKVGIIGIVNGLSSKELPKISKRILLDLIQFVMDGKGEDKLNDLIELIRLNAFKFIEDNKSSFKSNLKKLRYTHSGDRKQMTALLFILYNKGKGNTYQFTKPSLEHFEPNNIPQGGTGYYEGPDRDELIHSIGNMILMKSKLNSRLQNYNIKTKIEKIDSDLAFKNEVFFTHDIYKNLVTSYAIKGDTTVYKEFPDITKCYTSKSVPKKELFEKRTDFYVSNLLEMICSSDNYLLSGDKYIEI
jgi:uncharacterized protein with ParB-like and HNH nuclease domain